jgi:hypothetical protein
MTYTVKKLAKREYSRVTLKGNKKHMAQGPRTRCIPASTLRNLHFSDLLSLQNSSLKHKTFMPLMTLLGMSEGNCLCSK